MPTLPSCCTERIPMTLYEYQQNSRRMGVLLIFLVSLGMLWTGLAYRAPIEWLGIIGVSSGMLALMLLQGKVSGSRLTPTHLELWDGTWRERIALARVDHVKVVPWSSGWSLTLVMKDGKKDPIPGMCVGSATALADAFKSAGLPTT